MTRSDHVHHVHVVTGDHAIEVRVENVQARARTPVAEQARLHVGHLELAFQKHVFEEVDLADGEVVRRAPVRVDSGELLLGERGLVDRLHDVSFC